MPLVKLQVTGSPAPSLAACLQAGRLDAASMKCRTCSERARGRVHHCGRIIMSVAESVGGLDPTEIAKAYGVTRQAVEAIEKRALAKVARRYPVEAAA